MFLWDHLVGDCGMDFVPTYEQWEKMKECYDQTLKAYEKGEAYLDELVDVAEDRFRAWFFRSAERFPLLHPRFPVYVSTMLNEEHSINAFSDKVIDMLVGKDGQ